MTRRYSNGFSMIEVLVTFVIAAVGLMGLAAMQLITIKNANNSQFRTLATLYAYDMAERIRSNRAAVAEYVGADTSGETACGSCSSGGIAESDVDEWIAALEQSPEAGGLPEGIGKISQNGGLYEITIEWDEQSRDNSGGLVSTQSYTLTIDL
jgi:type IV pilus assembly protein PilV